MALSGSPIWLLVALAGYYVYAGLGVALTFHRQLSHRTYVFHPLVQKALMLLGSLANVGSPISWVAVHRAHHRYCDTPNDPHSPHHKPAWFVLFTSMYAKVSPKFAIDLMRDSYAVFLHKYYFLIQLPWMVLLYWLGGWQALVALHLAPGALTWLAGSFLNWFNHSYGYKVAETSDTSRNHPLTGFLVFGEGWHNSHHYDARRPTTRTKWWELDLLYLSAKALGGRPAR